METKFLDDAGDILGRYGLVGRDDWYSHKIEELREGRSLVVSVLAGVLVHMMGKDGGLVFFTDKDAKSHLSEGDGSYISSFDYEVYLERNRIEEEPPKENEKRRKGGGYFLGQSLASMLTSLNLIPETNTVYRRYFYDFLERLGLLDRDRRPTPKAVDMGYVREAEGVRSWYEWDMDFFLSQVGLDLKWGYMSKSRISEAMDSKKCNINMDEVSILLEEAMRPYMRIDEDHSFFEMIPNGIAVESGKARLSKYYEWHPECLTMICGYFLELKEMSKREKISLDDAKSHLSWMGEKGMSPGEEAPMLLLEEVDPECFERINAI